MTMILIGFLLVLFDYDIAIGDSTIGLLPNFVGYFLVYAGLDELIEENGQLAKLRPWVVGTGFFSGALYAIALFGLTTVSPYLMLFFYLMELILCYSIIYRIIAGIGKIEYRLGITLMAGRLKTQWIWMVLLLGSIYLFLFLGPGLSVILSIAYMVLIILFLVAFHKTSVLFRARPRQKQQQEIQ